MPLNFTTTAEASKVNGIKMLVHAPSGMGKTMLVATLPKVLLLGAEGGELSLNRANLERIYGKGKTDITYDIPMLKINTFADLNDAYMFITTSAHAKEFQSIALDSISEIAEVVLTNAKKSAKDGRAAYGDMNERMVSILRSFRDLPSRNVYFSSKQDREKDDVSGLMLFRPSMPGKQLTQGIAYFFDEVFALGVSPKAPDGSSYRFLRTAQDAQFEAKDRSGALNDIEEPHLGRIIAKIKNSNVTA